VDPLDPNGTLQYLEFLFETFFLKLHRAWHFIA